MEQIEKFLTPEVMPFLIFGLSFLAIGGLFYSLFYNQLNGRSAVRKRLRMAALVDMQVAGGGTVVSEQRRKQSIEKTLNEMASREKAKQRAKLTLKMRLNQADLTWTPVGFFLRAAGASLGLFAVFLLIIKMRIMFAVPAALLGGFLGLNFYVKRECNKRMRMFLDEFPNAIDIVTRGVKTGLPLGDCLNAIATEGQEPVRSEFQKIIEDVSVGLPLVQALFRFTHRVPIMEANFFAVVVALQSQLGGNLSEALGNLSRVLRERKMMKEKIKAFSSEAKASGMIIASMPVAVGGILSVTSPDYIGLLFSEKTGNFVLAGCALWMTTGVIVMRNMIRFDF